MGFKAMKSEGTKGTWKYLRATVQFGNEVARFDFKPGKDPEKDSGWAGKTVRVNNDDLPDTFQHVKPGLVIDDVSVLYDTEKNKAISIVPWEGDFEAVAYELGPRTDDGSIPMYEVKTKEETGFNEDTKKFYCAYEITDDPDYMQVFKGCRPRYHMHHRFRDDGQGMLAIDGQTVYKGKTTRAGQVLEWTSVHGIDEDMQWPDDGNTLPLFEERLLSKHTPVRIHIKDGYISGVSRARGAGVRVVAAEDAAADKPGLTDSDFGK